VTSLRAGRSGF